MNVKGGVGWVALGVSALALVVAGSGTAVYAAAAGLVNIADPQNSTLARVKASGRLSTTGQTASLDVSANISTPAGGFLTTLVSPTTATIGISTLSVSNPRVNSAASNANYTVYLERDTVDSNGNCVRTGIKVLDFFLLAPGDRVDKVYSAPLLIKPTAGAKYCLGVFGTTSNGASDTGPYFATATFTGYVDSGSYTGVGTFDSTAPQPDLAAAKP